jgi:tetratricopeptide (TPR) repeat protein
VSARLPGLVLAIAVVLCGPPGCVYYNGMYNANREAREAERLERQGRSAEARDRWRRAVIYAESVATRHPRSRWADDAMVLRGRGLVLLESYSEASTVLEQAVRLAGSPALRAEALTLLGHANLALRRFDMARAELDSALASAQPRVESEARLFRGRALLALGMTEAALADFTASREPIAPFDRVAALLQRRDTTVARAQLEALVGSRPYREGQWRGALDTLALLGAAESAARLTEQLVARGDLTRGARARLLLDDGDRRLAMRDTAAARARYRRAAQGAPDSTEARVGGVRLARLAVADATAESELSAASQQLARFVADGGPAAREAQPVLRVLGRIDSLAEEASAPDACWFARAELLRDSLGSWRLAAIAFGEMASRFPASPWTPKGILAAVAAGHPAADSLRALLDRRYPDSPYRLAALGLAAAGADADAYRALEDSLGRIMAQRGAQRPGEGPTRERTAPEPDEARPREERPGRPVVEPRPSPQPSTPPTRTPPPAAGAPW